MVRPLIALFFLAANLSVSAQTTTSSSYSKFGLGELQGDQLPQFRGMGGISTGVRSFDSYFNINNSNPASYSGLKLTVIDVGIYGNYGSMSRGDVSQTNANFNLSHLNFAAPISEKSALSFGLMPYSAMGYRFSSPSMVDTININNVYAGDGGISKVYLGYGIQFGKHISLGFNVNYLFGNLQNSKEEQYPQSQGAFNLKIDNKRYVHGYNFDLGLQYFTTLNNDLNLVFGYVANVGNNMRMKESSAAYLTFGNSTGETENIPLDSITATQGVNVDITMPISHKVGFSLGKTNKWLVGADGYMSNWSTFREGSFNPGLENAYGLAVGGQFTPDITSTKYFNVVDYKLGFKYNKTNIKINNKDINEMGVTLGLGLPLPSNRRTSFYKVSFAAEFMQRGSSDINLVKENFVNFRLGFTLNDMWFQRTKYN